MIGHHPLKMENRVQIPMRLPFIVYPPMFQGLGDRLSKSPWVSSILTVDAIFSNTLGEGSERSLIGKTTAYEQKTFSSNLNQ